MDISNPPILKPCLSSSKLRFQKLHSLGYQIAKHVNNPNRSKTMEIVKQL